MCKLRRQDAVVKNATLFVAGKGPSSLPVGKSVEWFARVGGFKPVGWSAARLIGKENGLSLLIVSMVKSIRGPSGHTNQSLEASDISIFWQRSQAMCLRIDPRDCGDWRD